MFVRIPLCSIPLQTWDSWASFSHRNNIGFIKNDTVYRLTLLQLSLASWRFQSRSLRVFVAWPSSTNKRGEFRLCGTYFRARDSEDRSCVSVRNVACILYPDNGQCLKNILTACLCLLRVLYQCTVLLLERLPMKCLKILHAWRHSRKWFEVKDYCRNNDCN
jgi:hypothetical protein